MQRVLGFFQTAARSRILPRPGGVGIVLHQFVNKASDKSVLICTGRAEAQLKYAEIAFEMFHAGFSVTLFDHRGQGFSGRQLNNPHPGHVRHFRDYVADLETVWQDVALSKPGARNYVIGHSLGGLITLHFLLRNPSAVSAAVLLAPLIAPYTAPFPDSIIEFTAKIGCFLGLGEEYFPGRGPFEPKVRFDENDWCGCRERFNHYMSLRQKSSRINLGGPTVRWVNEIFRATQQLWKKSDLLSTPILICTAGSDKLVQTRKTHSFSARVACSEVKHFSRARHELLFECEDTRKKVVKDIFDFFETRQLAI